MKEALKIKPKRLADEAFEIISTWIEGGRFAPGAHLSEGGLCADLGISRTPLREALFKLESHGFITSRPNRGFFVSRVDKNLVFENYPIIAALDALALNTSPPFTERQISRLKTTNRDIERAKNSAPLLYQFDLDFHGALIINCPNRRLLDIIEKLKTQTRRCDGGYKRGLANRALAHREHKTIIAALETGDNGKAAAILEKHWLGGIKTVTDWIDSQAKPEKTHDHVLEEISRTY